MNELYKEIAETVNVMIPKKWNQFYFYAQISETGGGTYFFYNTEGSLNKFQYSIEIPFKYNINTDEFEKNDMKLFDLCKKLRLFFKDNGQELWYSFTMSLENTGKFKMHYDYTNWFETDYSFSDQMIIWKYKYLNEKPQDKKLQKIIDRYLVEYPDKPI